MKARYRCTECDTIHDSFAAAADCHPGIGGVRTVPPEHCGQAMQFYSVGAPGVGSGWFCPACLHNVEITPTRILTLEETR